MAFAPETASGNPLRNQSLGEARLSRSVLTFSLTALLEKKRLHPMHPMISRCCWPTAFVAT